MLLQSTLQPNLAPARRLQEYLRLVRDISIADSPQEIVENYRARSQLVVASDRRISLSKRGLSDRRVRITRSDTWTRVVNPWAEFDHLPVVERGLFAELATSGQAVKMDRIAIAPDDPAAEYVEGMHSLAAAPMFTRGEPTHMVILLRTEPAAFSLDELATLVLTANLLGQATAQRVLAEELKLAHAALDQEFKAIGQIQRQMLPHQYPDLPGVTFAVHYQTSTRAGGDYYDFLALPDGRWGMLIADVSGHGAAAAVVVGMLHALLKTPPHGCPQHTSAPGEILKHLNYELLRSVNSNQFVTAFLGVLDPRARTFDFASAGHNPPRLLRATDPKPVPLIVEPGLPLAIDEQTTYPMQRVELGPGDRLVLYTDGITEAMNDAGEMFGIQGIDAALACCSRTPHMLIDRIISAVEQHCGTPEADDDRTLVTIAVD